MWPSSHAGANIAMAAAAIPAVTTPAMMGINARLFTSGASLIEPQVLVALPRMNRAAVAFVLFEFRVAKRVVEMIAERAAHDAVGIELGDRLAQRLRQGSDAALAALLFRQVVRRADERRPRERGTADAVRGGGDEDGEREIGIARRIGAAHLDAGRPLTWWDANERVRAALRPNRVNRRVPGGNEPLIGVHRGIADRGGCRRVRE